MVVYDNMKVYMIPTAGIECCYFLATNMMANRYVNDDKVDKYLVM